MTLIIGFLYYPEQTKAVVKLVIRKPKYIHPNKRTKRRLQRPRHSGEWCKVSKQLKVESVHRQMEMRLSWKTKWEKKSSQALATASTGEEYYCHIVSALSVFPLPLCSQVGNSSSLYVYFPSSVGQCLDCFSPWKFKFTKKTCVRWDFYQNNETPLAWEEERLQGHEKFHERPPVTYATSKSALLIQTCWGSTWRPKEKLTGSF